jgi:hypothetical protein
MLFGLVLLNISTGAVRGSVEHSGQCSYSLVNPLMLFGSATFKGHLERILYKFRQFETAPVFDSTFFSNVSNGN